MKLYLPLHKLHCSIVSLSLCLVFSLIHCMNIHAQVYATTPQYPYVIPIGQYLYSDAYTVAKDVKPYRKEFTEFFNNQKTKVIEEGDFVIREYIEGGKVAKDTLHFAVITTKITGMDTIRSLEKKEFKIALDFPLIGDITFKNDKAIITPSPLYKAHHKATGLHLENQNLYLKMQAGETFEFTKKLVGLSLISIPFKVRISSANSDIDAIFAQASLNNVGLLLGFKSKRYHFSNNKLKKKSITVGPFVGPTAVELIRDNLNNPGVEITRMGLQFGIGILGEINRWNIGLGIGLESVSNEAGTDLTLENSFFTGLIFGYSLKD